MQVKNVSTIEIEFYLISENEIGPSCLEADKSSYLSFLVTLKWHFE